MNDNNEIKQSYDAVVVGARVAGASTALLLARAGLRVLAVDKSIYGSDTTSTHALMRPGGLLLHRWGVLERVTAAGTPDIRTTTFHYGDEAIEIDIDARDGVGALYAPRRTALDAALVDAARDAGAEVRHGVRVTGVLRNGSGRVRGVRMIDAAGVSRDVASGIVIGADGVRSQVARMVGAGIVEEGNTHTATVYGYYRGLDLDGTHWYFNDGVAAGAIPTNDNLACVFAAMPPARYTGRPRGFDTLFGQVIAETDPQLATSVLRGKRVGKLHPYQGRRGFVRTSFGPGWALVGDAACFKDPLTAHGMTDALRDAALLADAVIAGTDSARDHCEATRHEFGAAFLRVSDEVASFDWDLEQVKALHYRLSKLMNREYELVRSLKTPAPASGNLQTAGA